MGFTLNFCTDWKMLFVWYVSYMQLYKKEVKWHDSFTRITPSLKHRVSVEWTSTITKYLKDQLNKLNDYHQPFSRMTTESDVPQKQWNYMMRLTDWLYEVSTRFSWIWTARMLIIEYAILLFRDICRRVGRTH